MNKFIPIIISLCLCLASCSLNSTLSDYGTDTDDYIQDNLNSDEAKDVPDDEYIAFCNKLNAVDISGAIDKFRYSAELQKSNSVFAVPTIGSFSDIYMMNDEYIGVCSSGNALFYCSMSEDMYNRIINNPDSFINGIAFRISSVTAVAAAAYANSEIDLDIDNGCGYGNGYSDISYDFVPAYYCILSDILFVD